MGLFVLPDINKESIDDLVKCAVDNIELWQDNKDCEYLLEAFSIYCLERAVELIKEQRDSKEPRVQ